MRSLAASTDLPEEQGRREQAEYTKASACHRFWTAGRRWCSDGDHQHIPAFLLVDHWGMRGVRSAKSKPARSW